MPIMTMQGKAADRRKPAEEATEGKRHSEGMLSRNTPYV